MTARIHFHSILFHSILVLALLPAACTSPDAVRPAPRPDPDRRAAVEAIRASGRVDESAVQVNPLRDPAVEGFLSAARTEEAAARYDAAVAALERALKLAPDAPDLVQEQAELEFLRGDYVQAEKLAVRSFQLGPRVGSLCRRNWQTVIEARRIFDDPATLADAERRQAACKVAAPVRM